MEKAKPENRQVLTVYINENDQAHGRALHVVIMERLKAEGFAGVTVVRGIAGFGAHGTIRRQRPLQISSGLPVRIEVVEEPDAITRALEWIRPMVSEGLVTVRDVTVSGVEEREHGK